MKVSTSDCSWNKLVKLAEKYGFIIFEGKRHTKVKDQEGRFITTIPRHSRLKKETVESILKAFIRAGADISYRD